MDQSGTIKGFTRQGYLYLQEKKAISTTWTKYYCQYKKDTKEFFMILYNQLGGKMSPPEKMVLDQCIRRASESIEKRFCFDVIVKEKQVTMTFQALSEEDRRLWLESMDGKEPIYNPPTSKSEDTFLDEIGFNFINKCLAAVEERGLHEQGLYRVVGVNSKVQKLISVGLDRKKGDKVTFEDPAVWETKTITSAVKNYLRSLPEPLMGFKYHNDFIKAAKHESKRLRILDIHKLVHKLPDAQFDMLEILVGHLVRVSNESEKNKMTIANLGVCFGPTLMRHEEETMAAIMDIKFCNIVVEILITNYDEIFGSQPEDVDPSNLKKLRKHWEPMQKSPPAANSPSQSTTSSNSNSRPVSSMSTVLSREHGAIGGHIYSNSAPVHPAAKLRSTRPVQIYNPQTGADKANAGFETYSSTSGSSDSLNGTKPNHHPRPAKATSPQLDSRRRGSNNSNNNTPLYSNVSTLANRFNFNTTGSDSPTFGSVKKRSSNDFSSSMNSSMQSSMTSSLGSTSLSANKPVKRLARALYSCKAENESELSFKAHQLIHNVRPSREPGWLEGTSCGKTGLLPENYVEYID